MTATRQGEVRQTLTGSGFGLKGLWSRIHNQDHMISVNDSPAKRLRRNCLAGFKGPSVTRFVNRPCWRELSFCSLRSPQRALPTETKVESGTSQRKSGISVNLSNSGDPLCVHGISYRRVGGLSTAGLFKKSRCSPLSGMVWIPAFKTPRYSRRVVRTAEFKGFS